MLASIEQQLPFHLNDTGQVNAAFDRWRSEGDLTAKRHVELWTYCFIYRYFAVKFTRDTLYNNAADMDALIEKAYRNVQERDDVVSTVERYAQWVSVVCKNTFLNYLRRRQPVVSIDRDESPPLEADSAEALYDAGMVYQDLQAAITRLPDFLRDIAHLRFMKGYSYEEIGRLIDRDLATVRSYVYKAIQRFRSDPNLKDYLGES